VWDGLQSDDGREPGKGDVMAMFNYGGIFVFLPSYGRACALRKGVSGGMSFDRLRLSASALHLLRAGSANAEKRVVIGNAGYRAVTERPNPRRDARDFAVALCAAGFAEVRRGLRPRTAGDPASSMRNGIVCPLDLPRRRGRPPCQGRLGLAAQTPIGEGHHLEREVLQSIGVLGVLPGKGQDDVGQAQASSLNLR